MRTTRTDLQERARRSFFREPDADRVGDPVTHANRLTSFVDPQSKCPGYKVTLVRVAPAAAEPL